MFDKEWGNKGFSSGTSLPLLLTFGWTFRRDPPSWPSFCKVSTKTGTRRNCKWGCQARKHSKGKRSRGTTAALLFQLFNHTEDKKKKKNKMKKCSPAESISAMGRQALITIRNNGGSGVSTLPQRWKINERRTYLDHLVVHGKAASIFHAWKEPFSDSRYGKTSSGSVQVFAHPNTPMQVFQQLSCSSCDQKANEILVLSLS